MKFFKYIIFGGVGFLIGRGFQIALDYPALSDYAEFVTNSMMNRRR